MAGLSMGGYGAMSPAIMDENLPAAPDRLLRVDLYQLTRKALAENDRLPDLFVCMGDKDFLCQRVTRYHQTFMPRWHASRYRCDDLPNDAHEFAIRDKGIQPFLDWIRREDVFTQKNKV